jgi:hypothetical protein
MYTDSLGNAVAVYSLGLAPAVSLSAKSTVSTGTALDGLTIRENVVLTVTTTARVSAGTVVLQARNDGVNFYAVSGASISTTTASATTSVVATNVFARYVRAAITSAITGGQITAKVGVSR